MTVAAQLNAPSAISGFTTRVDGAHLADLIQIYCQKPGRSVFRVVSDEREGCLFFQTGQVFHAQFAAAEGVHAIVQMLLLKAGNFEPVERPWPEQGNLELPADVALLRAAKHIDEHGLAASSAQSEGAESIPPPRHSQTIPRPDRALLRTASTSSPSLPAVTLVKPASEVHLSKTGAVLSFRGEETETLAEAVAFSTRLASLAGEALGLSSLLGFRVSDEQRRGLVVYRAEGDTLVGVLGDTAQLGPLERRLGLK